MTPMQNKSQEKHSGMIDALAGSYPGMKRLGFWKAVGDLATELGCEVETRKTFLPDAYRLNRETSEIEIHEVVRTHDLDHHKMKALGLMWEDWDCDAGHDWLPVLYIHRRSLPVQRVELSDYAYL